MERYQKAVNIKKSGCNCCEAVCKAYSDIVDINEEDLMKIASGFGLGLGTMEGTCGALVGANIILGLMNNTNIGTTRISKNLVQYFKEECGAVTCKDLKGISTGKVLCSCDDCVKNASIVLEKTLKEYNILKEEI